MSMGGGGAAGAYSNQSGPATVYNPTGQGASDALNQQIMQSIAAQFGGQGSQTIQANAPAAGLFDFSGTPGGQALAQYDPYFSAYGGFNPNNSFFNQWITQGAQPASAYAVNNLGPALAPTATNVIGATNAALAQTAPAALAQGGAIGKATDQILQTAFDPQKELYNQLSNQVQQQQNAINAMSGVGNTPYGAGLTGNALTDFGLKWQDRQLGREATGLGAAIPGAQTAAGLPFAPGMAAGQGYTTGGALGTAYENALTQGAGLDFATLASGAGTTGDLAARLAAIGNQQYALPQALIGDTNQYLQTGQNASQISGYLGNLGAQQQAQAFGGIGQALGGIGGFIGNKIFPTPAPGTGS